MKTTALKTSKKVTWAAVAAICVASVVGAAHADTSDVPVRTVRYADLNLNTEAGVAFLYNRIRTAAEQVCGDVDSRRLEMAAAARACVDRAMFTSVQAVNNRQLTSAYNAHLRAAKPITVASVR
jgi:UrcA family protein